MNKRVHVLDNVNFAIFFSCENINHSPVMSIKKLLANKYYVNISINEPNDTDDNIMNLSATIDEAQLVFCFITKAYTSSAKCKNELLLAYSNNKEIIAVILEKTDMTHISYALSQAKKFNFSEDLQSLDSLSGQAFDTFIVTIDFLLCKYDKQKQLRSQAQEISIDNGDEAYTKEYVEMPKQRMRSRDGKHKVDVISSVTFLTEPREKGHVVQSATITSEEVFKPIETNSENLEDKLSLTEMDKIKRFRKLRSSSVFERICGLNRLTILESRKRFVITSSYNHSIVVIDINGNWIEKRNLSKTIQGPWGICNNGNDEIYIGDNVLHHIVVLDFNFKFLRIIRDCDISLFYDLTYDKDNNELYAADLYNSVVAIFDVRFGRLKRKLYVDTPSYVRVVKDQLFILSTEYVYAINRLTHEPIQTISIPHTDIINGLYVDNEYNIFVTVFETNEPNDEDEINNDKNSNNEETMKPKGMYLYVIRPHDKVIIKKVYLGLQQVNDMIVTGERMAFICDTHFDLYEFYGVGEQAIVKETVVSSSSSTDPTNNGTNTTNNNSSNTNNNTNMRST